MDEHVATISRLNRRKFWSALILGFFVFLCLVAFFGFSGTFYAVGLGGMGDFYVSFKKLEGEGFRLHPHIGESGTHDQVPVVRNHIQSATIENLHIYKDLQLPTGHWVRIHIRANKPTFINGLIQDARFIDADIVFDDLTVKETNTKNIAPEQIFFENWTQNAQNVTIYNAKIVTDYLFQNAVSLNDAEIYIESIEQPNLLEPGVADKEGLAGKEKTPRQDGREDHLGEDGKILPKTAAGIGNILVAGMVLTFSGLGTVLFLRKRKLRKE